MSYAHLAHLARTARQPLTWLVIAAMALLALLALESTGSAHPPSIVPLTTVSQSGDNNGGQPSRHCGDGHGQDAQHNPHCRAISGGQ
jgi:hypothetical protein